MNGNCSLSIVLPLMALAAGAAAEEWPEEHFTIETVAAQTGRLDGTVAPEKWKPAAQPDLAAALEKAGSLKLEDVAPPPARCWVDHRPYLAPNPGRKGWDMVYPYYNTYRGEQQMVIHDFHAGRTRVQVLSTGTGADVLTKERIGFHMQPSYYAAGKLIFEVYGPVLFVVYDPAADRFVKGVKPFGDAVINGRCALGVDGMIYGIGWLKDKSGFVAYRFDPNTYEAKRYETFGPANPNRRELYRDVALFGDWLYAGVGNRPWHVVGFNFRTGEGRLLATTADIRGDYKTVRFERFKGGLGCTIRGAAAVKGIDDVDKKEFRCWLHEGTVHKREGDIPPWSRKPAARAGGNRFRWDREYQVWPADFEPPSPPPEIKKDAGDPDGRGRVALPWRPAGKKEWQTLAYTVKLYPGVVRRVAEVNDTVLFATDDGYGQHVFYCLKTRRIMRVGGTLSPYSIGRHDNRLYVAGYPSSQLYAYDFTRPVGLRREPPNPRRVGYLAKKIDTHCPMAGTIAGADGRIYCAGTTYGRRRVGGGFGWYDPQSGAIGGMPVDEHRFFWMTAADGGRYLLASSKRGDTGALFCWDTRAGKMLYQKQLFGGGRPGPVAEALAGGLVIGHHDAGTLYGLRAATGEVLWQKPVPAKPVTSFSQVRRHRYAFRRGPDGHIWSFFGTVLVRIDPRDARVIPVGRVEKPAQLAFAAGGVYIAGGDRLRRVVVPGGGSAP